MQRDYDSRSILTFIFNFKNLTGAVFASAAQDAQRIADYGSFESSFYVLFKNILLVAVRFFFSALGALLFLENCHVTQMTSLSIP